MSHPQTLAALALLAATIVSPASHAANEADTTKALETLGGRVTQSEGHITQIQFTDCARIGEAELRAIGALPHLKSLTLYGKIHALNDSNVGLLTGLVELENLSTEGAQLTDEGLAKLADLKNLRSASFFHLSFRMEGFTGKGFRAWSGLPKLERLTVAGMSMGDEGFAAISGITTLKELATWHTFQTEAGNAEIAKLPNLKMLKVGQRLPRTGVKEASLSDESLKTFVGIKTLETLKLTEARLTLSALRVLKQLPKLKSLSIAESEISEADLEALKTELPGVKIEHQPLTDDQRKKLEMYLK